VEFGRAVPAVGVKLGVRRGVSGGGGDDHLLAIVCRVPSSLLGATQTGDHLAAFLVLCSQRRRTSVFLGAMSGDCCCA
jgi:hypothetical protein